MASLPGLADETWRLATARDADGLRAAARLLDGGDIAYDAHRARAFALALDGDAAAAVAELADGRGADWPFPAAYAADLARIHFLAGDYEATLGALGEATRAADRLDPAVAALAAAVVRAAPRLRGRALRVVLARGTVRQRARNGLGIALARGS